MKLVLVRGRSPRELPSSACLVLMSIDVTCPIGDYVLPPEVLVWEAAGRDMFTRFKNGDQERRIFLHVVCEGIPVPIKREFLVALSWRLLVVHVEHQLSRVVQDNGASTYPAEVELMPHELKAIDEVYATLERREITLARQLEPRILRYLYHARFNVDRAVKELAETQKWRLEYFKQPICDEDLLHELNTVSTKSGPMANGDPKCLHYMG
ncbi:hypothetical protein FOZ63_004995, partial [Perkinsus olseni]